MDHWLDWIPPVNVALVATCGMLLVYGRWLIRKRRVESHRRVMITAVAVFGLFLALYAFRLAMEGVTPFPGPADVRPYYFAFLFTHMGLALATIGGIVPMLRWSLVTKEFSKHRRLAVWVWPAWLVSIAMGIVVYYLLYVRYA